MESYFKLVEKTLSRFPIAWQKNYYQNKLDLIINHEKARIKGVAADYNHEKNIITIYDNNIDSLDHELFHMAFRDKEKVGVELATGVVYGNGVCFEKNRI